MRAVLSYCSSLLSGLTAAVRSMPARAMPGGLAYSPVSKPRRANRATGLAEDARQRLRRVWLAAPVASHVAAPGAACPVCSRCTGALTLLTSRVIYYACDNCHHRWSAVPWS